MVQQQGGKALITLQHADGDQWKTEARSFQVVRHETHVEVQFKRPRLHRVENYRIGTLERGNVHCTIEVAGRTVYGSRSDTAQATATRRSSLYMELHRLEGDAQGSHGR